LRFEHTSFLTIKEKIQSRKLGRMQTSNPHFLAMAEPSISVVIPAFRAEHTIQRAIDSVLAQTTPASEIIVVDDGSPDNQAAIVEQYGLPVILVRQANGQTAAARNTGIERATGDFVAFLDADDYWEPHKLERQSAVFAAYPLVGLVASRHYNQEPNGTRVINLLAQGDCYDQVRRESGPAAFLLGTMLWTGTVMVRRELLITERFVSGLEPAEDRDLWIRLAAQTPVYVLSQPLATAVLEPGGISRRDIATDCTRMLEVVRRHRDLLGMCSSLLWRSYVRYRWAAMEATPRVALPLLAHSFCDWPAPFVGMPAMQSWGRLRRLVVLLTELLRGEPASGAVRGTP
jgi:glycosyltransferase involved in cell wall biosynthesis